MSFCKDYELFSRLIECRSDEGLLFWKPRTPADYRGPRAESNCLRFNSKFAGSRAINVLEPCGYLHGVVLGKNCRAHRVVWLLTYGEWPTQHIDHINGIRSDNRISNLRDVSRSENAKNSCLPRVNKSGFIGITRDNSKWRARIWVNKKRYHLGCFESFDDAVAARKVAMAAEGFHPNHGRPQDNGQ